MNYPLLTISGPSGSGKTTIVNLMAASGCYHSAVSCTTRKPRKNEQHGVDYNFLTEEEFLSLRDSAQLYECVSFNRNWYGVEKAQIDKRTSQKPTLIVVEPDGVGHLKQNYKLGSVYSIYFNVSFNTCQERMQERGDDPLTAYRRGQHDQEYFPVAMAKIDWDLTTKNVYKHLTCRLIDVLVNHTHEPIGR